VKIPEIKDYPKTFGEIHHSIAKFYHPCGFISPAIVYLRFVMVLLSIIVFIHKIFMTSVSKGSPLQMGAGPGGESSLLTDAAGV
jgi:hypothetical protein